MIDLTGVKHHPAVEETAAVLCSRTNNSDPSFFRIQMAYFLAKIAGTMRAQVNCHMGEVPVNLYAINLASSGFGKGHSTYIIEQELMSGFKRRFMDNTFNEVSEKHLWNIANKRSARDGTPQQEEFDRVEKEWKSAGPYEYTFDSGTAPAVKQLRRKLLLSGVGAINFQMDEIGSNLMKNTEVLDVFLELFDMGVTKEKLVKNSNDNLRGESLDGKTPANMLLFGTPAKLFDGDITEKTFREFLQTGYARRCLFGIGKEDSCVLSQTPEERYDEKTKQANSPVLANWKKHFHGLADSAMFNWTMTVPRDVGIVLTEYEMKCEERAKTFPDHKEIQKAELTHRYFKALKLAGAYAFVDQSPEIEMDHLKSAILLVEESAVAFEDILSVEPPFIKLAKFIATAEYSEPGITHAELTEHLPFYKSGNAARNEMMNLAQSWGYKNNVIIKKTFMDGLEFFNGETLKETNLDEMLLSYSTTNNWAYDYEVDRAAFDQLHVLTQQPGMHWCNHGFIDGHRSEEKAVPGFNMAVIDIDGTAPLHTVHELLSEYKFMTYTTKRHTADENRFRLIMPINYELKLDSEDYKAFMNAFMEWLPFESDPGANQRARKWETFDGGSYHYNLEGRLIDALPFIPKTKRNEEYRQKQKSLKDYDSLERWFAERIANGNRNNQMIKFALALVDSGLDFINVQNRVRSFNSKLAEGLPTAEIDNTIMVTVAKAYAKAA